MSDPGVPSTQPMGLTIARCVPPRAFGSSIWTRNQRTSEYLARSGQRAVRRDAWATRSSHRAGACALGTLGPGQTRPGTQTPLPIGTCRPHGAGLAAGAADSPMWHNGFLAVRGGQLQDPACKHHCAALNAHARAKHACPARRTHQRCCRTLSARTMYLPAKNQETIFSVLQIDDATSSSS